MPGNFIIKASQHPFLAGERLPAQLASLPDNRAALFDEAFVLQDKTTGEPLPNIAYRILLEDGTYLSGVTNTLGLTDVVRSTSVEALSLEVKES
jgi:type VI secretion system secreted protein VgrG